MRWNRCSIEVEWLAGMRMTHRSHFLNQQLDQPGKFDQALKSEEWDFGFSEAAALKLAGFTWASLAKGQISTTHQTHLIADSQLFLTVSWWRAANFSCHDFWKAIIENGVINTFDKFYNYIEGAIAMEIHSSLAGNHLFVARARLPSSLKSLAQELFSRYFLLLTQALIWLDFPIWNLDFGFWLDCLIQFDGQVQVQRSSSSSSLGRRSAPRWPIIILRNIIFCDHISMWFNAVIAYNYKVFSIIEIISNFRSRNPSSDDWTIARQPSYSRSLSDAWLLLINLSLSSTSTWSYILPQAKNSSLHPGTAQWVRPPPFTTSQRPTSPNLSKICSCALLLASFIYSLVLVCFS